MPRSDGHFPQYAKYKLDPDNPPANWDYGCRRCISCKKDWPNLSAFGISPCCGLTTGQVANFQPEMTWREAVSELNHFRFEYYYDIWNEQLTDEELFWTTIDYENLDELADELSKLAEWLDDEYGVTAEDGVSF